MCNSCHLHPGHCCTDCEPICFVSVTIRSSGRQQSPKHLRSGVTGHTACQPGEGVLHEDIVSNDAKPVLVPLPEMEGLVGNNVANTCSDGLRSCGVTINDDVHDVCLDLMANDVLGTSTRAFLMSLSLPRTPHSHGQRKSRLQLLLCIWKKSVRIQLLCPSTRTVDRNCYEVYPISVAVEDCQVYSLPTRPAHAICKGISTTSHAL